MVAIGIASGTRDVKAQLKNRLGQHVDEHF
jgi:hypothetical protein